VLLTKGDDTTMASLLYMSDRQIPLLTQQVETYDQLTVEHYDKWYSFFILRKDGTVEKVSPDVIDNVLTKGERYIDHTPHPMFMVVLAKTLNVQLPALVLEVVAGRWAIEQTDVYDDYDLYGVNE